MYQYKCTCRFNLLTYINGSLYEIRPGEILESKVPLEDRYLKLIEKPKEKRSPTKRKKLDGAKDQPEIRQADTSSVR